jgi:methionyl aminopeptidase
MMAGIEAAQPGNRVGDISAAVEDVAVAAGFGIVRQYVGHGIGTEMHQDPQVPNYRTGARGIRLDPGICLAIEPMLTLGAPETETLADGWTVVTRDGSLAAHFEHTIAVTERGPEILTAIQGEVAGNGIV